MMDEKDLERLKEIFVTRQECQTDMKSMDDKINATAVRLAVIEQQLKTITWILCAVGSGVIATLIKLFVGV